jgi:glycosyltransferase involved in cell wall biosynthesis
MSYLSSIKFPSFGNEGYSMSLCIWYVSKYVALPGKGVGGRGFMLMSEFVKYGHTSVIITSDSNQLAEVPRLQAAYQKQVLNGVQIYWVRTLKYKVAKSFLRVLSWLHFEFCLLFMSKVLMPRPDVVVVSSLSLLTIINGIFLRQRYNCKLVFEIRDIWPLTLTEEGGYSKINLFVRFLGWVEALGYRYSDIIVGTMPNLAEHVANVVGPGRAVFCIPMGFDPVALNNVEALPPGYERDYVPPGKFVVSYVGSIGITNSLDTMLECANSMVNQSNVHFLVVGDGDLKSFYIEKYAHLPNVSFAPKVSRAMVQSVLKLCDILYFSVHVSEVWRYGQSLNKVLDYMLSGKPIVASYTGFPSMIDEAGCGTFVPSGDVGALRSAIRRYASMDKARLVEIGARGKSWILRHRKYSDLATEYLGLMRGERS